VIVRDERLIQNTDAVLVRIHDDGTVVLAIRDRYECASLYAVYPQRN
jgi:hypothetical protein